MDFQGIHDRLKANGAPGLLGADEPRLPDPEDKKDKGRYGEPFVLVDASQICQFMAMCRDDEHLHFEVLADLSAADPSKDDEELWVLYQLLSIEHHHRLMVKAKIRKDDARIDTLAGIYRAAQWHERECAEMFGITFNGHPDPRHMLLPDDWEGFPLRKDYEFPQEYHGISCV